MRKFITISLLLSFFISLNSCYKDEDLNTYEKKLTKQEEYFWFYDHQMLANADTVQLIGILESKDSNVKHYVNRSCKVYNDTIYIIKKSIYPTHNRYKGLIRANKIEYGINIILQ